MKLYLKYFRIHLKSRMQYKTSFILTTIGQFFVSFNVFLGIWFMFNRFHKVKGYTYEECLICFSVVLLSFSIAESFFRGFDAFTHIIGKGEFDRILVRPRGLIFQVLGHRIEFTRIGNLMQAVVMLIYSIYKSRIDWDVFRVMTLIFMIIGGVVVFASIFLVYASICFFSLEGLEVLNILTNGAREYGKYPVEIYGKNVLLICTYIVPFAFFQYYPFLYLIGRVEDWRYMWLPFVSCLIIVPCLAFWRFGVRHYKSTGS